MFKKSKENLQNSTSKMDKIVTGIILGAAVVSIFWIARTKKWQELTESSYKASQSHFKKGVSLFGKVLVLFLSIFSKKK